MTNTKTTTTYIYSSYSKTNTKLTAK